MDRGLEWLQLRTEPVDFVYGIQLDNMHSSLDKKYG